MLTDFITDNLILAQIGGNLNQNQFYIIIAAIILILLMVIWQTFVTAGKQRPSKLARQAREDAERIIAEATLKAEELHTRAEQDAQVIIKSADLKAEELHTRAEQDAQVIIKNADLKVKEAVLAAQDEFEKSMAGRKQEQARAEERLSQREDKIDQKLNRLQDQLAELNQRDAANKNQAAQLAAAREELAALTAQGEAELQRISGLTAAQAKQELLTLLEESMIGERGALIRRFQEENRQRLQAEGLQIMLDAMQKYSGECSYERTTATIPLPNDEMKGRIIGREGRNIRTIEAATGASILIDDTPQVVVISCFDPVRREIARQTMEKLVNDGRIHPAHVEDIVTKTRKEIENDIIKTGQATVEKLGIMHLRPNIVELIGRLKYRHSFSQNVLAHSVEVAAIMGDIAANLGYDERKARRAGLLHDIGKAVDHEVEGSHAIIGANLLRRAGEDEEIINAVAAHHEDVEKTGLLSYLVQICDAISASRPGARSETTELYLKRLEDLERIGNSFAGVESCFAIQAGRELRVLVKPEKITEAAANVMAREMAERIEKEMRYPGQIRISVIRETRAVEYAK